MPRTKRIREIFRPRLNRFAMSRRAGNTPDIRKMLFMDFLARAESEFSGRQEISDFVVWGKRGLVGESDSLEEAFSIGHKRAGAGNFIVQEKSDVTYILGKKNKHIAA